MKVLMCIDGSSFSDAAVEYAGGVLEGKDAQVIVLRVVPEIAAHFEEYEEFMEVFGEDIHRIRKLGTPKSVEASLKKARDILKGHGIKPKTKTRKGKAADGILEEAKEGEYDLIVLASYGDGISKFKLGSVSREVVHLAHVPVLVYKGEGGDMF
jgi:nucleotide-binding universal stress UspA family protein